MLTWHDGLKVLLPAQRVRHVSGLHPDQLVPDGLGQLCRRWGERAGGQAGRVQAADRLGMTCASPTSQAGIISQAQRPAQPLLNN